MKTKLISMLLACIMLASLTACADDNDKPGSTPEESTKETDVQTTEDVTTEENTTEEDTTEPTAELAFNKDLLSDIGLTYSELVNKRGEKARANFITKIDGGGLEYTFEHGQGVYAWGYDDLDYGREIMSGEAVPFSEIDANVHLPKSDAPCRFILTEAKDLFLNASFPMNVSDIKNIDGIENYRSGEDKDHISSPYDYYSGFFYSGIYVSVLYNDIDTIEADSEVHIYMLTNQS